MLRGILGKLNWVAGMIRPEMSFFVCETTTRIKIATISEISQQTKLSNLFITSTHNACFNSSIRFIKHQALFWCKSNGESQGVYLILLSYKNNHVAPIVFYSTKLKHVTRSTVFIKTLALSDDCDTAFFLAFLTNELILSNDKNKIHIKAFTDKNLLYETLNTTKSVLDRCLCFKISALRDICQKKELLVH